MIRNIISFVRLPLEDKKTVMEVVLFLFYGRILLFLPYKYMKQYFGKYSESISNIEKLEYKEVKRISRYIFRIGKRVPWKCTCLVNAIAAKIMLKRRNIPATIYFGMARDKDRKLVAHAWVKCGDVYVVGQNTEHEYKSVGHFT